MSRVAPLLLLLLPGSALAEAHLIVSAVGDVRILVDERPVGNLAALGHAPVVIEQPGRHALRVETHSGAVLAERNLQLTDGESLSVHWTGEAFEIQDADALQLGTHSGSGQQQRRPSVMQTAQAGTTAASLLAPTNPLVAGVSTGLSTVNAGSTLMEAARTIDLSGPREQATAPATSAHEDHSLDSLERSGFDPYEATGGRPSFDASLATVTFVAPAGTQALITIDSQPVATLAEGAVEATVPVMPGMHRVMIFDASGVDLLHRGYLTVSAGYQLELRFSATEPPVSTLPDTWR